MDKNSSAKVVFETLNESSDVIAWLFLSRKDHANAFNASMMQDITDILNDLNTTPSLRAVIISGEGKHFSAGADLNWMKASADLSYEENLLDSKKLSIMFEALFQLAVPTIAIVEGAAYGGAVGLAACCDIVLCDENAKFCLSEVRLGLIPAVILPYLAKRILPGQLRRLSLSARVFNGSEAVAYGLADKVFSMGSRDETITDELNHVLSGGPKAQSRLKSLHRFLEANDFNQCEQTVEAIARARSESEGQSGLAHFFAKKPSPWSRTLNSLELFKETKH